MKKVAIIEDEPSIRQLYELKLQREGYDVKTADDGVKGLALVESFHPDIILLDLLMPNMNGEEMLATIRKQPWGENTKVIILTNVSRQEAPETLNDLEISRYIIKAEQTAGQVADIVKEVLSR